MHPACRSPNPPRPCRTVIKAQPGNFPVLGGVSHRRCTLGSYSVSNDPFKSTTPDWAYSDKNSYQRPEYKPREDDRRRCRVCDVPMTRAWFYISVDGPQADKTDSKFDSDDFCSVRCIKRRLNGLPGDDERAMNVLLQRVEDAEAGAKDAQALSSAHELHLELIRTALASVLDLAPGLARGLVPPPGAALAQRVTTLQSLVAKRVFADPDQLPRMRRH
jgi:hypothetical protein